MHSEISNKPIVKFSEEANAYFNELITILFWKNYFSFIDSAFQYVLDMENYIETYIAVLPAYVAPHYFDKYKKEMKYVTYQANKQTTWYIFFKQKKGTTALQIVSKLANTYKYRNLLTFLNVMR